MGIKIKERSLKLPQYAALSKKEVIELRKATSLPFILKGIMTVEDALTAVEAGVDTIVFLTMAVESWTSVKPPLKFFRR